MHDVFRIEDSLFAIWNIGTFSLGCVIANTLLYIQALDTFNAAIVSPIYYVMFTTLTIVASAIMFKVTSS